MRCYKIDGGIMCDNDDNFNLDEIYTKLKDKNSAYFDADNLKNKSFYSIIQNPLIDFQHN